MDFGLTDDQREIQRTARELLAERARPERVREHAEAERSDEQLWRELCELGWPGIALSILCEELGSTVAAVPFLPSVLASTMIEHAGSPEQHERFLPALASGESKGALGVAAEGVAELVVGGSEADVIVLVEDDGGARVMSAAQAEITPSPSIDPTRSCARVNAPADG